ncbi:hypothetical protein NHJ13051_009785 [Beauveria bassiana]
MHGRTLNLAVQSRPQGQTVPGLPTSPYWLPPELWLEVCDHLSEHQVSSLSRTNRTMLRLLQPYLWRRNVEESDTTCLPYLAAEGHVQQIQALKKYDGFRTDARNHDGDTALLCAIDADHEDVAIALIEHGGLQVNMRNGRQAWRPLTLAISSCQTNIVRKLLECDNIEPNGVRYTDYGRPLFLACRSGNAEILKLLLASNGIDLSTTDEDGRTALHVAVSFGPASTVKALLYDGRTSLNAKDRDGRTALGTALVHGRFDAIEVLYAHGIRPGPQVLDQANYFGSIFTSKFLTGEQGFLRLSICPCAAARGHRELVSQLLPYTRRRQREESLALAAFYGHTDIVELLLKYVSPIFKDWWNCTPAWHASSKEDCTIARLFETWDLAQGLKRKRGGEGDGEPGDHISKFRSLVSMR